MTFASMEDELAYYKRLAKEYKQSVEDGREELDEFQISSRELEAELETQLEQAENKNKEQSAALSRLTMEVDMLREKMESTHSTAHKQVSELESELSQVKAYKDELQRYIRELEQSNDDLERAKRATVVSLEDFESRMNLAIERNAFLESELEEKETMQVTVQRLKDEARDLRQELTIKKSPSDEPRRPSEPRSPSNEMPPMIVDSNKLMDSESSYITPSSTPAKALHFQSGGSGGLTGGTPLTPSARISALNIVGDLLRKVGALESKLASCRNVVKEQPRNNKSGSTSPLNSPRAKRWHRSATVGSANNAASAASSQQALVKLTL